MEGFEQRSQNETPEKLSSEDILRIVSDVMHGAGVEIVAAYDIAPSMIALTQVIDAEAGQVHSTNVYFDARCWHTDDNTWTDLPKFDPHHPEIRVMPAFRWLEDETVDEAFQTAKEILQHATGAGFLPAPGPLPLPEYKNEAFQEHSSASLEVLRTYLNHIKEKYGDVENDFIDIKAPYDVAEGVVVVLVVMNAKFAWKALFDPSMWHVRDGAQASLETIRPGISVIGLGGDVENSDQAMDKVRQMLSNSSGKDPFLAQPDFISEWRSLEG